MVGEHALGLRRPGMDDPVTIRAAIEAELPRLRSEAESLMLDTGKALRPTEGWTVVDGIEVQATDDLFTSACKIQTRTLQAREAEVGGRTAVEVRTELHLPASTAPLAVGDLWEMTAAHALSLAVVGARYRVTAPVDGTLKTARRYEVERVVS